MNRILGDISNSSIVSRREDLAVVVEAIIDSAIHPSGDLIRRGALLAQRGNGKYRAYAEGVVVGAFSAAATTFSVDLTQGQSAQYFKAGDVIESVAGVALGTIATFDPSTGSGTLTANSANALAAGQRCRINAATGSLASKKARVLQEEMLMDGTDAAVAAYSEGFFTVSRTGITAAAETAMGVVEATTGEVRMI
jgi:hypothetical protein